MSEIKYDGAIQFKKDTFYNDQGDEYTVEGEWLNGVPHGVCIVENEDFRGVVTFTHGMHTGGPQWIEMKQTGVRMSMEYIDNGKTKGI